MRADRMLVARMVSTAKSLPRRWMWIGLFFAFGTSDAFARGVDIVGRDIDEGHHLPAPSVVVTTDARAKGTQGWRLLPYSARYAGASAHAVAVGRISGSHRQDIVVVNEMYVTPESDRRVFLFRPEGAAVFQAPLLYPYGQGGSNPSVAVVDLDGLHGSDVVVGGGSGLTRLLAAADGTLSVASPNASQNATSLKVVDVSGDGRSDIVAVNGTDTSRIHLNLGNGQLQPTTWDTPIGGGDISAAGDVDRDGRVDVALGSRYSSGPTVYIYRNTGVGSLVYNQSLTGACPEGWGTSTNGVAIGDVNGDGYLDIVASSGGNRPSACVMVFHGDSSSGFSAPLFLSSYDIPQTIRVADMDGDSRDDIIVAHGGWNALGVYLQQADGSLASEQLFPIPYASHYYEHSFEIADLNLDGCADVALVDYNNGLVTLQGDHCEVVFMSDFE